MSGLIVVVQLVISFVAVALIMPGVLFAVPAARESDLGPALSLGLVGVIFLLVRRAWPRRE